MTRLQDQPSPEETHHKTGPDPRGPAPISSQQRGSRTLPLDQQVDSEPPLDDSCVSEETVMSFGYRRSVHMSADLIRECLSPQSSWRLGFSIT
ncbi:unnamed protein product [Pleuronectes platessa]|uniref:Uncharacterized protein n=1 Tax=Pleuronectes platessa TaxID=8262 RepID=A0A9N7Z7I3_PLEPL|nr:unnamed protein product [Pleuronectes platessa]